MTYNQCRRCLKEMDGQDMFFLGSYDFCSEECASTYIKDYREWCMEYEYFKSDSNLAYHDLVEYSELDSLNNVDYNE